jgi:hypothetical protein
MRVNTASDYSTPLSRSRCISGIGQPEMAEDLGILLAELRGDSAHRHALADLDRDADVWDLAQLRVATRGFD